MVRYAVKYAVACNVFHNWTKPVGMNIPVDPLRVCQGVCRRGCDRMAGVAHRDRLLEADADAAARGVVERLFGLVAEVIEPETVKRGTEWIR